VALISFTFGLFLPFVRQDLDLSPVEVGMLQGVWWTTSALLSVPCSVWFSRFRPIPLILVSLVLDVPFLVLPCLASSFAVLLLAQFVSSSAMASLGFAIAPLVTGCVTQVTGSLQGLLVLCMLTGVGAIAGIWYPPQQKASNHGVEQ
jgi:predicted MFS family arabinose efflux permease